jgi:hypothetical protein
MNDRQKRFQLIVKGLRPLLVEHGFRPDRSLFSKDVGDVVWYIAVSKLRDSSPEETCVFIELNVGTPNLDRRLLREPLHWTNAPIGTTLGFVAERNGDIHWCCKDDEEVQIAVDLIGKMILKHGFPFLERFKCTDDVIEAMPKGAYIVQRGQSRIDYDVAVWKGQIDPAVTPYVPTRPKDDD